MRWEFRGARVNGEVLFRSPVTRNIIQRRTLAAQMYTAKLDRSCVSDRNFHGERGWIRVVIREDLVLDGFGGVIGGNEE